MPEEGLSGRDPDANQEIWPCALAPQRGCRASATGNFSLGSARVPAARTRALSGVPPENRVRRDAELPHAGTRMLPGRCGADNVFGSF